MQGQSLARSIGEKLNDLSGAISRAVNNVERSGVQQPAHTVAGRLEQAQRWLNNPSMDDKGLGQQAIGLIVEEGKKVGKGQAIHYFRASVINFLILTDCHKILLADQKLITVFYSFHQVASGLTGPAKTGILALCEEVDSLSQQLSEMCRRGQGDTPQAQAVAR